MSRVTARQALVRRLCDDGVIRTQRRSVCRAEWWSDLQVHAGCLVRRPLRDAGRSGYLLGQASAGGAPNVCGWLQDKYGLSWQIVPNALLRMIQDKDRNRANRVVQAMLQMTKLDIAGLQAAYDAE